MHLWFYSSEDAIDNIKIDSLLIRSLKSHRPQITYIPSCPSDADECFDYFIERFSRYGPADFEILPCHTAVGSRKMKRAFEADLIYLAGGNTFAFLDDLRQSGLIAHLRRYAKRSGVLAGCSAGGIIMTPNISTASYPDFDRDENEVGLRNYSALRLVNFEFFPHFEPTPAYIKSIRSHSIEGSHPIYAVPDGGGIRCFKGTISFMGQVSVFYDGTYFPISGNLK